MTDGNCLVCGESYTKRGMGQHLRSCLGDLSTDGEHSAVHLRITAPARPDYWVHLALEETTTLATLDAFLRELWLDCCGHMSAFTVGDSEYRKPYSEDGSMPMLGVDRRSMDVPLESVLESDATDRGQEFTYEYDFGTTTELAVRVLDRGGWDLASVEPVDRTPDLPASDAVRLFARNEPPEIACEECGTSATRVCQSCPVEGGSDAWLCGDCTVAHEAECDRPTFLPRVNSPRTGVCGYTGRRELAKH